MSNGKKVPKKKRPISKRKHARNVKKLNKLVKKMGPPKMLPRKKSSLKIKPRKK